MKAHKIALAATTACILAGAATPCFAGDYRGVWTNGTDLVVDRRSEQGLGYASVELSAATSPLAAHGLAGFECVSHAGDFVLCRRLEAAGWDLRLAKIDDGGITAVHATLAISPPTERPTALVATQSGLEVLFTVTGSATMGLTIATVLDGDLLPILKYEIKTIYGDHEAVGMYEPAPGGSKFVTYSRRPTAANPNFSRAIVQVDGCVPDPNVVVRCKPSRERRGDMGGSAEFLTYFEGFHTQYTQFQHWGVVKDVGQLNIQYVQPQDNLVDAMGGLLHYAWTRPGFEAIGGEML
jgi:hypothetical protein